MSSNLYVDPHTGLRALNRSAVSIRVNDQDTMFTAAHRMFIAKGSALAAANRADALFRRRFAWQAARPIVWLAALFVAAWIVTWVTPVLENRASMLVFALIVFLSGVAVFMAGMLREDPDPLIPLGPDVIELDADEPWEGGYGRWQELLLGLTPEDRDLLFEARSKGVAGWERSFAFLLDQLMEQRYDYTSAVAEAAKDIRAHVEKARRTNDAGSASGQVQSRRIARSLVEANPQGTALRIISSTSHSVRVDTLIVPGDAREALNEMAHQHREPWRAAGVCGYPRLSGLGERPIRVSRHLSADAQEALFDRLSAPERDALLHGCDGRAWGRKAEREALDTVIAELAARHLRDADKDDRNRWRRHRQHTDAR